MTPRPLILDVFCKVGGASVGYHRAGFDVFGVDHEPQPRYPFPFLRAEALEVLRHLAAGGSVGPFLPTGRRYWLAEFAAVHASPPCQRYSRCAFQRSHREKHPDLLAPARKLLQGCGRPYVIENVDGAPVQFAARLCGLMFGLKVFRHRCFESSHLLMVPAHPTHRGRLIGRDGMCCVVGHGGGTSARMRTSFRQEAEGFRDTKADWQTAMGIDWMSRNEMAQAVPPAYTHYLGLQLRAVLGKGVDA